MAARDEKVKTLEITETLTKSLDAVTAELSKLVVTVNSLQNDVKEMQKAAMVEDDKEKVEEKGHCEVKLQPDEELADAGACDVQVNSLPQNYWTTMESYPAPDLRKYPVGFRGTCVICDIEPNLGQALYFLDAKSPIFLQILEELPNDPDLKEIPEFCIRSGDLVGIKTSDLLVRGLVERTDDAMEVFQIDLGEYIKDPQDVLGFYHLPAKWRDIPATAMLAIIRTDADAAGSTQEGEMCVERYSKRKFEVVDMKRGILYISLAASEEKNSEKPLTGVELTQEERDMLYEEQPTTNNPMVAVTGYDPQDDARLCKHYDPKTGGCFKGVHCNKIHQPKDDDGWTKDKKPVTIDIPSKQLPYAIGAKILIKPSHVNAINVFYAHAIPVDKHQRKETAALFQLQRIINLPENKQTYKKYGQNIVPSEGELVLARYADGLYYRARIHTTTSNYVSYLVFFVDYGNIESVSIDELFQWEAQFNVLPFQAIRFVIANIKPIPSQRESEGINALQQVLGTETRLWVEVMDNKTDLLVLVSTGTADIGEILIMNHKALPREVYAFSDNTLLPG